MVLPVPKEVLKLLFAGQLKWDEGKIKLLGLDVWITPIEYFEYFTKFLIKEDNKKLIDLYYLAGWIAGYEITKRLMRTYNLKTPQDRYKIAMDFLEVGGYGKYKTIEFRPGIRSRFIYLNNPLPLKFYPSKTQVCHYMRGLNAGGGTWVHKYIVNCIELVCAAQNTKYDEFINFTLEDKETIYRFKDLIKNQFYDIKSIVEFEINYVKARKDEKEILLPNEEVLRDIYELFS